MEGEVRLDVVYWGVIIVFDLAELQEAVATRPSLSIPISLYIDFRPVACAASLARKGDLLFAALWRILDEEVDSDVTRRCLEQDRHTGIPQALLDSLRVDSDCVALGVSGRDNTTSNNKLSARHLLHREWKRGLVARSGRRSPRRWLGLGGWKQPDNATSP